MKIRSKSIRRSFVFILCAAVSLPLMPFHVKADSKDKVIIHIGKPSIWSLGQAHYLLAKMHNRNQGLSTFMPDEKALDPNRPNATRLELLKTLLDVEAQFNQRIGAENQSALREEQFALRKRENARAELALKENELDDVNHRINQLRKQLAPLEEAEEQRALERSGEDRKVGTSDDELPNDEDKDRQLEIAPLNRRLKNSEEKRDALNAEITKLEKTANDPVATPKLTDPELTTTPINLPGLDNVKDLITKAFQNSGSPTIAASIALDNFIQMQYEIISKQLTLLRDEIGPEERIIFVELPSSIYTVPGKADDYVAQVQWQVTRYYEDKGNFWRGGLEDSQAFLSMQREKLSALINQENEKMNQINKEKNEIDKIKIEGSDQEQKRLGDIKNERKKANDEAKAAQQKQLDDLNEQLCLIDILDDGTKELDKLIAQEKASDEEIKKADEAIKKLKDQMDKSDKQDKPTVQKKISEEIKKAEAVKKAEENEKAEITKKADELRKEIRKDQETLGSLTVSMWDENDVVATPTDIMLNALKETDENHIHWKNLDYREEAGRKKSNLPETDIYRIRALDIIPRQSALNVNDYHATVSRVNFLGVLKTFIGLGVRVNYQRQRELYEEFLQQEIFASGFGKGLSSFGWTYGSLPGSRRISPGVRTSYAVLAVPKNASMLELKATGVAFNRCKSPDYNIYNKMYEPETKQEVATERFYVKIPNEKTERFTIESAQYTTVRKGQPTTVIIKGNYFSPTAGILVNGEALKRSISVTNNLSSKSDCFDPTEKKKIDGCYEQVSSNEIVANFTMNNSDYVGTPTLTLVTPQNSSAINYFKLDVNYHQEGRRSLDEMSLTEPVFIDDFSLKEVQQVQLPNREFPNRDTFIFARLTGSGLRRRATIMINDQLLPVKDPVIELYQHPISKRIQPRDLPAMEIARRSIRYEGDKEFALQESTHAYLLYFRRPTGREWKVRYYNRTKQSFDAQEHTHKLSSPLPYKVLHYLPDARTHRAIANIRFDLDRDMADPVITIDPRDGTLLDAPVSEGNGKWRQAFTVNEETFGTTRIEREKIIVTVAQGSGSSNKPPTRETHDISLPIIPQITRIANPRTGRASGYADEEPIVTITGFHLQNIASVFFGEAEGKIIGSPQNGSILVKVPKRDGVTKGEAIHVPVRLKTKDAGEVASAVMYTYFGAPIPMIIYRSGQPYRRGTANDNFTEPDEMSSEEPEASQSPPPRVTRPKPKRPRSPR